MTDRLFRAISTLLLLAYPPAFRRQFGAEMRQFLTTSATDSAVTTSRTRLLLDLALGAGREWRSTITHPRPHASPRRRGEPMRNIVRDVLYALRLFRKSPGFAIAAVITLALGIGANTAIFTLADATLLRPLQVREPEQLVAWPWSSSYPDYVDYTKRTDIFEGVAAFAGGGRMNFVADDTAQLIPAVFVSGNAFDLLGVTPAQGRLIAGADDVPGGPLVGVLGYDFWRSRFGGDPSVVGRTFKANGRSILIIGVTGRGFRGVSLSTNPSLYIPVAVSSQVRTGFFARINALTARGMVWLNVIGRLRHDVTAAEAGAAMTAMYVQLHPRDPGEKPENVELRPLSANALGGGAADLRRFVFVLLGVVTLTLLIGCANLANLLLGRAAARRREVGVRLAMGASRWRVLRLQLVESVVLAGAGGLAGLAVAQVTLRLLSRYQLPGNIDIAPMGLDLDARALLVTFGVSLLTGILFGIAPAIRASRTDVLTSLRDESRGTTSRASGRSALLAAQVALSLVLLAGTGLFAKSVRAALERPLGFDATDVVSASVNVGLARYTEPRAGEFYAAALDRIRQLPQIDSAAWAGMVPTRGAWTVETSIETASGGPKTSAHVNLSHVGPAYFRTMGTRVIAGREFTTADGPAAPPVVIINEAMARKYWDGLDPLRGRIVIGKVNASVVGVVETAVDTSLTGEPTPFIYLAFNQSLSGSESIATDAAHLFVRSKVDTAATISLMTEPLRAIDPEVPVYDVQPFADRVAALLITQRMGLTLFTLFSIVALCLAAVGVYGVASYVAALRTREIGVRVALGATASSVRRLILVQNARPLGVGIVVGLALAWYASRAIVAFLIDVSPTDPATFLAVSVVLILVAAVASYLPARRASRVDPVTALRAE